MTKNQQKHFIRIWIGSQLFHSDFGFDTTPINMENIEVLEAEKIKQAVKFLKNEPALTSTDEVFEYITKKYK